MITSHQLHNFFAGNSSEEEILLISKWAKASEENTKRLQQERVLYNILLLHEDEIPSTVLINPKRPFRRIFKFARWSARVAAVIVLIIISYSITKHTIYSELNTALQTINVPTGQYISMQLPDGSNVWINAQTTIKYPAAFGPNKRTIYLDGEAYFQVARDESHPFEVETSKGLIRVLGTEFNVKAYSHENEFTTSLLSGEIEVGLKGSNEMIHMTANSSATLEGGFLKVNQIESHNPYTWKNGLLTFSNVGFEEMVSDFKKIYGVDIIIESTEVMKHKYTGKFRIIEGVDYALSVLQKSINFEFEHDTESNIIYIK